VLIFVSDLHLTDDARRSSIKLEPFLDAVVAALARTPTGDTATLVLLGDIFEMLKSDRWCLGGVRPWDDSDELSATTMEVFQRIVDSNTEFFDGLANLSRNGQLAISYVPGNHDRLLDMECGRHARQVLRERIPALGQGDGRFSSTVADDEHGVIAVHGHAFDPFNRVTNGGRFIPGDAMVVEVVARLPLAAARFLRRFPVDERQYDEDLRFLQELDNVRPQDPRGLIDWIEWSLSAIEKNERSVLETAVLSAIRTCADEFDRVAKAFDADGASMKVIRWVVNHSSFANIRTFRHLPQALGDEVAVIEAVGQMIEPFGRDGDQMFDLFIAGHTHLALRDSMVTGAGRRMTYLNTGTWRRVNAAVSAGAGSTQFDCFYDETLLCVHRRDHRDGLRYEFTRRTRGYGVA
jgi:UDP-2,3-diacylglucosamine pyrophosphatase LpxH